MGEFEQKEIKRKKMKQILNKQLEEQKNKDLLEYLTKILDGVKIDIIKELKASYYALAQETRKMALITICTCKTQSLETVLRLCKTFDDEFEKKKKLKIEE